MLPGKQPMRSGDSWTESTKHLPFPPASSVERTLQEEMKLGSILEGVRVTKMIHAIFGKMIQTHDIEINAIHYDSRRVDRSDLFVALRGASFDGHRFIQDAIERGAGVVVLEDDTALPDAFFIHAGVPKIVVDEARTALATMAGNFYRHPSRRLRLIGVTGT